MNSLGEIHKRLQKVFPFDQVEVYRLPFSENVLARIHGGVLWYEDMPRIADAFGTERINFGSGTNRELLIEGS